MENEESVVSEILAKMSRLCSHSEQCSFDIRKKIIALGGNSIIVEKILGLLEKGNYLNDERYVKAYVADKFKFNKWGKIKMRYYLKIKGLPDNIIQNGFDEIDEEKYREVLIKTMKEKAKTIKKKTKFEKMGQVIRFAQTRGFEPELIHRYLNQVVE